MLILVLKNVIFRALLQVSHIQVSRGIKNGPLSLKLRDAFGFLVILASLLIEMEVIIRKYLYVFGSGELIYFLQIIIFFNNLLLIDRRLS